MLAEELTVSERALVRRAIEQMRRGESAARIRSARVVGVSA